MHEMAIAEQLMDQVLAAAGEHDSPRVVEVELAVGAMRLVVPEAMQLAFEAFAEGTIAAGAALKIVEEPIRARCRACGREFASDGAEFACPDCGLADAEITAGADIVLSSMVIATEEGAEAT